MFTIEDEVVALQNQINSYLKHSKGRFKVLRVSHISLHDCMPSLSGIVVYSELTYEVMYYEGTLWCVEYFLCDIVNGTLRIQSKIFLVGWPFADSMGIPGLFILCILGLYLLCILLFLVALFDKYRICLSVFVFV